MPSIYLLAGLALLFFIIWRIFFYKSNWDYWKKTGLPFQNGSMLHHLVSGKNLHAFEKEKYDKFKETKNKAGIIWEFSTPNIYVMDCELIKNVLVKDFENFVNRRPLKFGDGDIIGDSLLTIEGQDWKNMRSTLSPIFTTGKIRRMFEIFDSVGVEFSEFLKKKDGAEIDIRKFVGKYTIGVISKVVFGLNYNNFTEGSTEFEAKVTQFSVPSITRILSIIMLFMFPKVANMLKIKAFSNDIQIYFKKIVADAIEAREKYPNQKWNDFLELLLETRTGKVEVEADNIEDTFEKDAQFKSKKTKILLNDRQVVSNAFLFLIAGFDTTETTLTWAIYELAKNPEMQEKIKNEIEKHTENDGKLTYEVILNMEYLDRFIQEILRKYPPAPKLERVCENDYKVCTDSLNFTIPKGSLVQIPISSIHYDEDYWPNPEKFDPDRFLREEKEKRHPYSYLPFGQGPRNCIGMRFAMIEAKVCLAHLVQDFEIIPTQNTPIPVTFKKVAMKPEKDVLLSLKPRK